jgi:hypothetical protein
MTMRDPIPCTSPLHFWKNSSGVQEEVMTLFKRQAADFYDSGIQKLVPKLHKFLDNGGDYVEK